MPLKLNDLIKKAKMKGLGTVNHQAPEAHTEVFRPWQQESVLFTDEKPTTKRQQSDNKPTTKRQQTDNKVATNQQQKPSRKRETDNKVATEPETLSATKWQQTGNKVATNHCFSSLVGLQRMLMIFIYNECKIARSKSTENLSLEHISKTVNSSTGSIKTTLQRLEVKGFLERVEYKNGRGGWTKYLIPDKHFQKILHSETDNKPITNRQQTDNKVAAEPATQPTTSPSSSSGNYIYTTTTGDTIVSNKENQLSEEWLDVDIEPLSFIGFTKTHIFQIASQNKLLPQIAQESIYSFSFDLQKNNKAKSIKGDPINFFMGILRNGKPYVPPSNYESPQDKAMRIYKERMREIETKRESLEKESKNLAYKEWFSKLTDDRKKQFLPENLRRNANVEKNKFLEGGAMAHFEAEVWPDKKKEIEQEENSTEQREGTEEVKRK